MKKQDTVTSGRTTALNHVKFKCGECLHFKKHTHASKPDVCANQGVRHYASAPTCFTPDVTALTTNSDQFVQIVSMFNDFNRTQQRILLGMLRGRPKSAYTFGQKLYFRAVGKRDYLSNYLSGYVVGTTSSGDIILQGDPDKNRRGNLYTAIMHPTTELLTLKQYKQRRQELKDEGKEMDPDQPLIKLKRVVDIDYEPPTLDGAPASWFSKTEASSKRTKKKSKTIKPLDGVLVGG